MTLRAARPEDAPAIAVLATQLGYPSRPEEAAARLRDVLARPDDAVLVAEDADGAVIGYGHVGGTHHLDLDPYAEIRALVVDESRRSRGTGAALVAAMMAWGTEHGYREMRVRSNVVRERAHAFYERLGFARVKRQQVFALKLGLG